MRTPHECPPKAQPPADTDVKMPDGGDARPSQLVPQDWPMPSEESWTDDFYAVEVYAWVEMAASDADDGGWSQSVISQCEDDLGLTGTGTPVEPDEDARMYWVLASPAPVPAQKGIPSEEWQFEELRLSDDPMLRDDKRTRFAQGHHVVRNYLSKWNLEADLSQPVVQTAEGYQVFATIERPAKELGRDCGLLSRGCTDTPDLSRGVQRAIQNGAA